MTKTLVCIRGAEVTRRLAQPDFRRNWTELLQASPGASAYQGASFVATWYGCYGELWEPVLLMLEKQGVLCAAWPLAYASGNWVVAGAHQAEYQGWLALPEVQESFVSQALNWLSRNLGSKCLRVKYLPASSNVAAIARAGGPLVQLTAHRRPLMRLDAQEIRASLAKKSNKSRFNRLSRLGSIKFEVIEDLAHLDPHLDRLISFYDLRQGAINQSAPFQEDARKREFHRSLLAEDRQGNVVMVGSIDGAAFSGFWGLRSGIESGATVHLGMLMHSPSLAEHSPGKLLLLKLSECLASQGVSTLDLTPGGDPWKERFANDHDEVFELRIWGKKSRVWIASLSRSLTAAARSSILKVGVTPDQARTALRRARRLARVGPWLRLPRRTARWLAGQEKEYRVYCLSRQSEHAPGPGFKDLDVQVDDLRAMLSFVPGEDWQSREAFWSQALSRLEDGHSAYTISEAGRLRHSGWIGWNDVKSFVSEIGVSLQFAEGSVSLYDFYTHPEDRGKGLYRRCLKSMLAEAFSRSDTQRVHIGVMADNGPSRHVIESLGFEYLGSLRRASRFGRARVSCDPGLDAGSLEVAGA